MTNHQKRLTLDESIFLRDLINKVRKSNVKDKEHENRYYDFQERILCTICYEQSLFQPPIKKVLARWYRIDKYKDTGEESHMFVCGDHSDDFDGHDDKEFLDMWDIAIVGDKE